MYIIYFYTGSNAPVSDLTQTCFAGTDELFSLRKPPAKAGKELYAKQSIVTLPM